MRNRISAAVFYGWWVVFAGLMIQLLQGSLFFHSFGAYFVYFQSEFGWTRTMLTGAFSLQRLESGLFGPIEGWLIKRFGARLLVSIGAVIAGAGLMLLSRIDQVWQFYFAYLIIAMGSSVGGFIAISSTVTNWFRVKRSRAIGIAMSGFPVGGMLVPVLAWSMGHYGWRLTSFVSGLIIIAIGVPVAQLLRNSPEEYGLNPDGVPNYPATTSSGNATSSEHSPETIQSAWNFTVREAMKTRAFWLISGGHGIALLVVSTLLIFLIPHIVERIGLSVELAATVVTLMTAIMIFSQVFGGALGDKIDKRIGLTFCLLGHATALFGLAFSTTIWQIALFAVVHGLAWGTRGPLVMSIRADYFGRGNFATIMGFSSLIMMIGMIVGPLFTSSMADRMGDYKFAFIVLASISALGSVLFLFARTPPAPARSMQPVDRSIH
jgi:MFS family permease